MIGTIIVIACIIIGFLLGGLLGELLMGIGGLFVGLIGTIVHYKFTRIVFSLGLMALGGWLIYAGWIEEDIHWAWATFAGIPCAYIGLLCATAYIKLLFLIPIALMGGGGYLGYLGWIEEEIHWAWAAFAGIPCILGGLALWAIMSQEEALK